MLRVGLFAAIGSVVFGLSVTAAEPNDRPDKYRFDPVTETSREMEPAITLGGSSEAALTEQLARVGSFTIECFARPEKENNPRAGRSRPVVTLDDGAGTVLRIELHRRKPPHAHVIWRAVVEQPGQKPTPIQRVRYRDIMYPSPDRFRHFAIVSHAERRTLTFFIDYTRQAEVELPDPFANGRFTLSLGGVTNDQPFTGEVTPPVLRPEALKPWQFLRATLHDLSDVEVSFKPTPGIFPEDAGHVDLKLRFGAIGDGVHDDTAAFARAFEELDNRIPIGFNTLLIPPGTYRITEPLRWTRYLSVRGFGEDRTILQLDDAASGFDDPSNPRAVVTCSNFSGRGRGSGSAMQNYLADLTIDTGQRNPGAIALRYHTNNNGAVRNVRLKSGDGSGVTGLDMTLPWPGPGLIEDVTIRGFDHGVDISHREYSMVFVGLTLIDQRVVGINNRGNSLAIERLVSQNRVPAIRNHPGGLIVLIDGELTGGANDQTAIENRSVVYLRDLTVAGYRHAILDYPTEKDAGPEPKLALTDRQITFHVSHPPSSAFPTDTPPEPLPIATRPEIPWDNPETDWVNVLDFADRVVDGDWSPAVQAAIDSGHATVYFPEGSRVRVQTPVIVRGSVRRLLGMRVGIGQPRKKGDTSAPDPPLVVIDSEQPAIIIEGLHLPEVAHRSATDLIIRDAGTGSVRGTPGCGRLFLENALGILEFDRHQRVWCRQLNCESKGDIPEILNDGAQLWILGYKTEYASINLVNQNGSRTEILGGLIYPVHPVPAEMPMFKNVDSDLTLVHAISAYKRNHKIYVEDTRGDQTVNHTDYHWFAGRMLQPMYSSSGADDGT